MSKSSKLDNATAAVQAKGTDPLQATRMPVSPLDTADDVTKISPEMMEEIANRMKAEGGIAAEKFFDWEPWTMIRGWYLGSEQIEIDDIREKDAQGNPKRKVVNRLRFELLSGARISVIGTAQLDTAFLDLPGDGSCGFTAIKGEKRTTSKKMQMDVYEVWTFPGDRKPRARLAAHAESAASQLAAPLEPDNGADHQ